MSHAHASSCAAKLLSNAAASGAAAAVAAASPTPSALAEGPSNVSPELVLRVTRRRNTRPGWLFPERPAIAAPPPSDTAASAARSCCVCSATHPLGLGANRLNGVSDARLQRHHARWRLLVVGWGRRYDGLHHFDQLLALGAVNHAVA
eukprot:2285390-Prymnesium_polylepis.1